MKNNIIDGFKFTALNDFFTPIISMTNCTVPTNQDLLNCTLSHHSGRVWPCPLPHGCRHCSIWSQPTQHTRIRWIQPRKCISVAITLTGMVLKIKINCSQLGGPPLLSSSKFGRGLLSLNTFVTQEVLTKRLGHCPLKCQKLQLHGTRVGHIALRGLKTMTCIGHWAHLTFLFLWEDSPQTLVASI